MTPQEKKGGEVGRKEKRPARGAFPDASFPFPLPIFFFLLSSFFFLFSPFPL